MEHFIRRLEKAELAVAGFFVTAIMLVITYDAAGRYIFKAPLPWSFDLVTNYLMIGAAYFAISATYRRGDHINIDLIHAKMPKALQVWTSVVCSLLAAALFAVITYGTWTHMIEAFRNKEFFPGYITWPAWLSYLPIPLGTGLLVLRLLHHSFTLATQGEDPNIHSEGEHAE